MTRLRRGLVGALSFLLVLLWLGLVALPTLCLAVAPLARLWPGRRLQLVSVWARLHCRVVVDFLRVGGARCSRVGGLDTRGPGLIVANHQSVLDIPILVLMSRPWVPAFVARDRYARPGVPIIPLGLRLAECPIIDPHDREGALAVLRAAARRDRTYLIFPEGHRSGDGTLQAFRPAGLLAMLRERRVPVWLVATNGLCPGRRLIDFVLNVHRIEGRTEVVGRYDPPAREEDLPAFVEGLHRTLDAHIATMRERGVPRPSRVVARPALAGSAAS